jgi:hypothetical protein
MADQDTGNNVLNAADRVEVTKVHLAEYSALRAEITTLLQAQITFLQFSVLLFAPTVTLFVSLAALHERFKVDEGLVTVILPLPFCVFGILFGDVSLRIQRVAVYLHFNLRPRVTQSVGHEDLFHWEDWIRGQTTGTHRSWDAAEVLRLTDSLRWCCFFFPAVGFTFFSSPYYPLFYVDIALELAMLILCAKYYWRDYKFESVR